MLNMKTAINLNENYIFSVEICCCFYCDLIDFNIHQSFIFTECLNICKLFANNIIYLAYYESCI